MKNAVNKPISLLISVSEPTPYWPVTGQQFDIYCCERYFAHFVELVTRRANLKINF